MLGVHREAGRKSTLERRQGWGRGRMLWGDIWGPERVSSPGRKQELGRWLDSSGGWDKERGLSRNRKLEGITAARAQRMQA